MDIYHKLFSVARKGLIHSAPIIPGYDRTRILDIGTGTGIWAIEMAEYVLYLNNLSPHYDCETDSNLIANIGVPRFWDST